VDSIAGAPPVVSTVGPVLAETVGAVVTGDIVGTVLRSWYLSRNRFKEWMSTRSSVA